MKKLTPRQQYWLDQIKQWQASGLSQAAFCRSNDLNLHDFYNWKSMLKKKQMSPSEVVPGKFLPIVLAAPPSSISVSIHEATLNFDADTDEQLFLKLVRLLKEAA